jgi:hypothetical protein
MAYYSVERQGCFNYEDPHPAFTLTSGIRGSECCILPNHGPFYFYKKFYFLTRKNKEIKNKNILKMLKCFGLLNFNFSKFKSILNTWIRGSSYSNECGSGSANPDKIIK